MFEQSNRRLFVFHVLILSMVLTLGIRLYYLQVSQRDSSSHTVLRQHQGEIVVPAPRGAIVDDTGEVLVSNRTSLVISVDRAQLQSLPDKGDAVLKRLATLIKTPKDQLSKIITPCGPDAPKPCWKGSPYQPVPVVTDASPQMALEITEHREDFPGVTADPTPLRAYPYNELAAHTLGYVGPVTQEELDTAAAENRDDLNNDTLVGRTGLEAQYDRDLRGQDGEHTVDLDNKGFVIRTSGETPPQSGNTLITSINQKVQAVADKALKDEIEKSQKTFDNKSGRNFAAPTGAAVVMDPQTGRIIALSSYPTYNPTLFVGGISEPELETLSSPDAGVPLLSRATQGQFAPGSTFKLSTSSAIVMDGQASLDGKYACPPNLNVAGRVKENYDAESLPGDVDLAKALAFSCDTFFYKFAMDSYFKDQGAVDSHKTPEEPLQHMARAYGFSEKPLIDLPDGQQTAGRIADRKFRQTRWEAQKDQYCAAAKRGYPNEKDAARKAFLTKLASENCTDGWRYGPGDDADLSIGQGETTVSPLQLALAYSALVNGGKLYEPRIGRAIVDQNGKVIREINPQVKRKVPVRQEVLDYIRNALAFNKGAHASGEVAFGGFDFNKAPIGGKTGTAEVFGKQDTSWFASWSPTENSHFVVVGMIEQAGLGSRAAAPMVRQIYEGIYGLNGKPPIFKDGKAPDNIPDVKQRITPLPSEKPQTPGQSPSATPSQQPGATPSAPTSTPSENPARISPSPTPTLIPTSTPNPVPTPTTTPHRFAPTRYGGNSTGTTGYLTASRAPP